MNRCPSKFVLERLVAILAVASVGPSSLVQLDTSEADRSTEKCVGFDLAPCYNVFVPSVPYVNEDSSQPSAWSYWGITNKEFCHD